MTSFLVIPPSFSNASLASLVNFVASVAETPFSLSAFSIPALASFSETPFALRAPATSLPVILPFSKSASFAASAVLAPNLLTAVF
jgi:hypothetical protein